ncbi:Carboxylesterase 5A [Takifugu flavidus]|uniref:Carboxylesterase 5A n=1 Tax=Takifugu flavidus TaxID=433684 RepID=A0A5C6PD64_9TELE|nr:Carboxylesterase 5A [Takifugu flavidus]
MMMCIQDPDIIVTVSQIMSLQYTPTEVSEDCLYLNVYAPAEATRGDKLPVMVWIHGGGLAMGAASQFDGAPLAAYENIVTVIVQYRLGILGFLSTGDDHAKTLSPKAEGLFQRAIFQSGVATVGSYTIKDPLPQAKIIANLTGCDHSSTEEMIQCVKGKPTEELIHVTKKMKIFLGAVVDGDFLTDTAEELFKKNEVLKVPVMMGITNHEFGWILPQSFAPPGWDEGMTRESVLAVVNMFNPTGVSATEAAVLQNEECQENEQVPLWSLVFQPSLANSLITDQYLRNARTPAEIRDRFTDVLGDILMTLPVLSVAGYLSDAGVPVYLYEFVYRADMHRHSRPGFVKADHGDDVAFVFGSCFWDGHTKLTGRWQSRELTPRVAHPPQASAQGTVSVRPKRSSPQVSGPLLFSMASLGPVICCHGVPYLLTCFCRLRSVSLPGNVTKEDEDVCRTMMAYWATFIRTGSPTSASLVHWPQYNKERQEYLELGSTQTLRQKLKEDGFHFMTVVLPQRLKQQATAGAM